MDHNALTLLPCTMENGVFLTNVKWKIELSYFSPKKEAYYSPVLFMYDPINKERIKIQLRLVKRACSNVRAYQLEYWQNSYWVLYLSKIGNTIFEYYVRFPFNIYYAFKTLREDLRQYLATIHGETIEFGQETHSIHECSKEVLFDFIDQEYDEDFIIECQGKQFKIKKIILQARSPVFDAMLSSNNFKEAIENRMVINDYRSEIVEKMIKFFQTDFVKNTTDFEVELYEIARKYMSESFMKFTRLLCVNGLAIGNYAELVEIVRKHDDHETEELMNEWYLYNLGLF